MLATIFIVNDFWSSYTKLVTRREHDMTKSLPRCRNTKNLKIMFDSFVPEILYYRQ